MNQNINQTHLFLVYGVEHWKVLQSLYRDHPLKNYVLIEPSLKKFQLAYNRNLLFNDSNVLTLIGQQAEGVLTQIINYFELPLTQNIQTLVAQDFDKNYYNKTIKNLQQLSEQSARNNLTIKRFNPDWTTNILKNLKWYCQTSNIQTLNNYYEDKPALFIAAGPSLDENITTIKKYQSNHLIFAVDTAARALINNDIKIDYLITLDTSEINFEYLTGLNFEDTVLIAPPLIKPEILKMFKTHYTFNYNHPLINYIDKINCNTHPRIIVNESCSSCGLDILNKLGCSPIYLIGHDFGWVKPEKSHNITTMKDRKRTAHLTNIQSEEDRIVSGDTKNCIMLKAVSGINLYSTPIYSNLKKFFEQYIQCYNLTVYTTSLKSAVISNVPYCNLETSLDLFNRFNDIFVKEPVEIVKLEQLKEIANLKTAIDLNLDTLLLNFADHIHIEQLKEQIDMILYSNTIESLHKHAFKQLLFENNYNVCDELKSDIIKYLKWFKKLLKWFKKLVEV